MAASILDVPDGRLFLVIIRKHIICPIISLAALPLLLDACIELREDAGKLFLLLVGEHGEDVLRPLLAPCIDLLGTLATIIGEIDEHDATVVLILPALDIPLFLKLRKRLGQRLGADTQQIGQVLLAQAVLDRQHGEDALLPGTGTIATVIEVGGLAPSVTSASCSSSRTMPATATERPGGAGSTPERGLAGMPADKRLEDTGSTLERTAPGIPAGETTGTVAPTTTATATPMAMATVMAGTTMTMLSALSPADQSGYAVEMIQKVLIVDCHHRLLSIVFPDDM